MKIFKNKEKEVAEKTKTAALLTAFFVIIITVILLTVPVLAYNVLYKNKMYQGVSIDGVAIGNLTRIEAQKKIESFVNDLDIRGFQFLAQNKKIAIKPTSTAVGDIDLTYNLISFDIDEMVEQAFSYGRDKDITGNVIDQARAIFNGKKIPLVYTADRDRLIAALQENFSDLEAHGSDPIITFEKDAIVVSKETNGSTFNYEKAIDDLEANLNLTYSDTIQLEKQEFVPAITKEKIENNIGLLTSFLEKRDSITLTYKDETWKVEGALFKSFLYFKEDNGDVQLALHKDTVITYLEGIEGDINLQPSDAVLEFSADGTEVTKFTPHGEGRKLNTEATFELLSNQVFDLTTDGSIQVVVDTTQPSITLGDLNELGIKEILGVGTSDYAGSPVNRRHNIEAGRKSFDGVLLAPGEEFSAITLLGNIDASNGYKQELVIKGNETKPEFGGGLCQVSTTMFRAALNAGVDITARTNHSYNVIYYYPIGTDATIYDPYPDFKFINNTGHHILIHTINDTENSKLIYQIWGTNDGRKVGMTDPVTYDWISPPPEKLIETLDLAPGVKKCTESAHAGVKAYFDHTITYADGTVFEKRYNSTYRPWQRVCLIGVAELSTEEGSVEEAADVPIDVVTDSEAVVEVIE